MAAAGEAGRQKEAARLAVLFILRQQTGVRELGRDLVVGIPHDAIRGKDKAVDPARIKARPAAMVADRPADGQLGWIADDPFRSHDVGDGQISEWDQRDFDRLSGHVVPLIRDLDEAPLWDLADQAEGLAGRGIRLVVRSRVRGGEAVDAAAELADELRKAVVA